MQSSTVATSQTVSILLTRHHHSISVPQKATEISHQPMAQEILFTSATITPFSAYYEQLYEQIRERLRVSQGQEIAFRYRDDPAPSLISGKDLDNTFERNSELIIRCLLRRLQATTFTTFPLKILTRSEAHKGCGLHLRLETRSQYTLFNNPGSV
jgi:hypothetical protein